MVSAGANISFLLNHMYFVPQSKGAFHWDDLCSLRSGCIKMNLWILPQSSFMSSFWYMIIGVILDHWSWSRSSIRNAPKVYCSHLHWGLLQWVVAEVEKTLRGCLHEKTCTGASFILGWLVYFVSYFHEDGSFQIPVIPLNPKIKIWILICCPYSFPTEVVGRR